MQNEQNMERRRKGKLDKGRFEDIQNEQKAERKRKRVGGEGKA